jgi:hypothetical protein
VEMNRMLKVIGATLTTVLAIGAIAISQASAAETKFHSEVKTTDLHMEQQERTGGLVDEKSFQAGTVTCKTILYEGQSIVEAPFSTTLGSESFGCGLKGKAGSVVVEMAGCNYILDSGEKDANGNLEGNMTIECPAGQSITYVYRIGGIVKCSIYVPGQVGLNLVTYTNEGTGAGRKIHVSFNITGISYDQTAGSGVGVCPEGEWGNGTWAGTETLRGFAAGGGPAVGTWVQ